MTAREVAGEHVARLAAPFLVIAPAAIFFGSGDAVFLGVGAWAVALMVLATGRRGRAADLPALAGGLLFGAACLLSYGLVLLAAIPVVVAVARRRVRPLAIGAVVVPGAAAAAGFWWFAGLAATRREYLVESVARLRPGRLFLRVNVAAFAVALNRAAVVGLARLRDRRIWLLVGAVAFAVALADLSLLSKGEVERIWLPFVLDPAGDGGARRAAEPPRRLAAQAGIRARDPDVGGLAVVTPA